MQKNLSSTLDKDLECQKYKCPRCAMNFTALDARKLINIEIGEFICERCKTILVEEDNSLKVTELQTQQSKLMKDLKEIIEQLKKTEGIKIPVIDLTVINRPDEESTSTSLEVVEVLISDNTNVPVMSNSMFANFPDQTITNKNQHFDNQNSSKIPSKVISIEPKKKETPPWLENVQTDKVKIDDFQVVTIKENEKSTDQESQQFIDEYLKNQVKNQEQIYNEPKIEQLVTPEEDDEEEEMVKVGDRSIPLSQVTEEDKGKMTTKEYEDYFQKYQNKLQQIYE